MKRVVLVLVALLLLSVVVGVSYIKTTRADTDSESLYREVQAKSEEKSERYLRQLDSVKTDLKDQQAGFLGAMNQNTLYHREITDSLTSELVERDSQIASLKHTTDSLKAARSKPAQASKKKPKTDPDKKIADHYRQRFSRLPADLSSYERKVAIGEIKSETADKYGISIAELDRIRKKFNIDF